MYRQLLRQREEWIRFSYSNEDTKDEERRKGWVVDGLNVVLSPKPVPCPRPANSLTQLGEEATCPNHFGIKRIAPKC